jgi:poly [ADP-ribose] polymerase
MAKNNNKFYLIQVLESDKGNQCYMWTRWGRVGVVGQTGCLGPVRKDIALR